MADTVTEPESKSLLKTNFYCRFEELTVTGDLQFSFISSYLRGSLPTRRFLAPLVMEAEEGTFEIPGSRSECSVQTMNLGVNKLSQQVMPVLDTELPVSCPRRHRLQLPEFYRLHEHKSLRGTRRTMIAR